MALIRLRDDELAYLWFDDHGAPLQLGLLAEFDPAPAERAPVEQERVALERTARDLAGRAVHIPALGRRVVWTGPGEGRPVWAADPAFDPRAHVGIVTLPAGADVGSWAATRAAQPVDRNRPLWRADVIGGLSAGRFAVLLVVSHVLADGLGGVRLLGELFDRAPDTTVDDVAGESAPALPSHRELIEDQLHRLRTALQDARRRRGRERSAARGRPSLAQIRAATAGFAGREPATSLPRSVGRDRRLAVVSCPLADLGAAGHASGVTVNDLLLAAVTNGLRQMLAARGELTADLRLRCNVPAALPGSKRQVASMLLIPLPVGEPGPSRRLALVHRATADGKERLRAAGRDATDLRLPLPLARWLLRASRRLGSRRLTLSVTDIPGPPAPLWLAGSRMCTAVPIAPLAPLVPLSVAALSYAGRFTVSVTCDAGVTDVDVLADGVAASLRHPSYPAQAGDGSRDGTGNGTGPAGTEQL